MFESVPEEFLEELPREMRDDLDAYFREMSIEKLGVLIEILHEFIVLVVSVKESQDSDEYEDTTNRK